MKITGYGNASVKIEAGNQAVFFDPYQKDLVKVEESQLQSERRRQGLLEARHIFLTHGHMDHAGSVASLYAGRDVRVYCTKTPAGTLRAQGFPEKNIRVIEPGDTVSFDGMNVTAFHTKHCRFDAGEIMDVIFRHHLIRNWRQVCRLFYLIAMYPAGKECLMYMIEADGLRLLLLGSAGLDRSEEYPVTADAMILPYQGRSDMPEYCMGIVDRLKPSRVILDHYDNSFPPFTCMERTEPFVSGMKRKYPGIPCQALRETETIIL